MKNIKRLTSLSLSLLMIATSTLPGLPNALAAEKKTSRIIQLEQQKNEAAQNTEELEKTDSHSQESESQQQPEEESNQIILNEDGSINAENASYSSNPGTPAHIDPDPLVKLRSTNAAELTNFEPSLFTGAFNYSFPLDLPPGRNGFGPSLGLNYSSQDRSLSSQVAFGWSMPEVSISRQAKEGINNLYTNKKHFTYTIGSSGGELVPLARASTEPMAPE
jgi:hypothetical protein